MRQLEDPNISKNNQSFSHRMGLELDKNIQINGMDKSLRNRIWNLIFEYYFKEYYGFETIDVQTNNYSYEKTLFELICDSFLKKPVDTYLNFADVRYEFYNLMWYRVYDFVEFMLHHKSYSKIGSMQDALNRVLEEEFAGYRIIDCMVVPITNTAEINSIEQAAKTKIDEVNNHITNALRLLSAKPNPDPQNSIKESISAVEALCKKIANSPNTTLSVALKEIEKANPELFDDTMKLIITKLWHFSNVSSGVRHALGEGKTEVNLNDARFILVVCSALINYLTVKTLYPNIKF